MKLKLLLTTTFLISLSLSLFAKPLVDSIGVKNDDGKKMIIFKVKAGDSYYSIGRRYHVKPEALMKYNGKKKAALSIGAIVEVPTDIPFKKSTKDKEASTSSKKNSDEKPKKEEADVPKKETKKEKKERLAREEREAAAEEKKHKHKADSDNSDAEPAQAQAAPERVTPTPVQAQQAPPPVVQQQASAPVQNNTPPFQYKVSAGETLYAISKRFNTTVDELTQLNNLTSTNIQPGQLLMVRSGVAGAPAQPSVVAHTDSPIVAKRDSTSVVVVNRDSSERHLNANRFGLFEKNENGVATWMDDPGLDANKKLVLHRTAPIGTVIKITNPMTNRTTFAKVVGRFTDSEATKDVIIVMTKNVADALGAPDKRFHVDISYGSPTE
jgi:LysM repeat protein